MKWIFRTTIAIAFSIIASSAAKAQESSYIQYVNPYIGSADHGHVFVGANVPNGLVQLGPSQIAQTWDRFNGWDWCSGYNYISEEILGFTHTHLSGTGIGDLNDMLRSEEHTSELQSRPHLVCRLLL